jgi:hypothetical protein
MRVVIYHAARPSSDSVDQVFIDAAKSAETTNRPEFIRLLTHSRGQRSRVRAVMVCSLTHFSK